MLRSAGKRSGSLCACVLRSAGKRSGVEETGEREKSSCGEDGRMDKVGCVDKWAAGLS